MRAKNVADLTTISLFTLAVDPSVRFDEDEGTSFASTEDGGGGGGDGGGGGGGGDRGGNGDGGGGGGGDGGGGGGGRGGGGGGFGPGHAANAVAQAYYGRSRSSTASSGMSLWRESSSERGSVAEDEGSARNSPTLKRGVGRGVNRRVRPPRFTASSIEASQRLARADSRGYDDIPPPAMLRSSTSAAAAAADNERRRTMRAATSVAQDSILKLSSEQGLDLGDDDDGHGGIPIPGRGGEAEARGFGGMGAGGVKRVGGAGLRSMGPGAGTRGVMRAAGAAAAAAAAAGTGRGGRAAAAGAPPNLLTAAAADFAYVDARAEEIVLTSDIGLLMSKISDLIDEYMANDLAKDIAVHGTSQLAQTPDEREFLRRESITAQKERLERQKKFGVAQHVLQR